VAGSTIWRGSTDLLSPARKEPVPPSGLRVVLMDTGPFSYMEPILNWAFASPASAFLRRVFMSTESEEVANTVNIVAAKRIQRKGLLWISDIATSEDRLPPVRTRTATLRRNDTRCL
jgi:hypothetical protein